MIIQELRDYLADFNPELVLFDNPSYDGSIVGYSSDYMHIIYAYDKMVLELMDSDDMTLEDAEEFVQYNTLRALPYAAECQPIVLMDDYNVEEMINKVSKAA